MSSIAVIGYNPGSTQVQSGLWSAEFVLDIDELEWHEAGILIGPDGEFPAGEEWSGLQLLSAFKDGVESFEGICDLG